MEDKIDITVDLPTEVVEELCNDFKEMEEDRLKDIILDLEKYIAYPFETDILRRMYSPTIMSNIHDLVKLNKNGIEVWREEHTGGRKISTILGPYILSWGKIRRLYDSGSDYRNGKLVIPRTSYEKLFELKNTKWEKKI